LPPLPRGPRVGGAGQHTVLGRHPPVSGPLAPAGQSLFHAGGAEYPRAPGHHEARPLGVGRRVQLEVQGPEVVGLALRGVAHAFLRIRSTSEVVEWPGRNGITRTWPPAASTTSRPTMLSRS